MATKKKPTRQTKKKPTTARKKKASRANGKLGGRPKRELDAKDLKFFDAMCVAGVFEQDIADVLGVSTDTINRICKDLFGIGFAVYRKQKTLLGRVRLRQKQHEVALMGNVAMLIWLGKQELDQREPGRDYEPPPAAEASSVDLSFEDDHPDDE